MGKMEPLDLLDGPGYIYRHIGPIRNPIDPSHNSTEEGQQGREENQNYARLETSNTTEQCL
jgi:hypothetical protein